MVIGLYYIYTPSAQKSSDLLLNIAAEPAYQSQNMTTRVYNPGGDLLYKLTAGEVSYYPGKNDAFFQSPGLNIYTPDGKPSWYIRADLAKLTQDRFLYLTGHVELQNRAPNAQLQQITMATATINLNTQIITSPDQVRITGSGFYSTGSRLQGNLKEKTADLLENVKTFYSSSAAQ